MSNLEVREAIYDVIACMCEDEVFQRLLAVPTATEAFDRIRPMGAPETQVGEPYVTYTTRTYGVSNNYWRRIDRVTFIVTGRNYSQTGKIQERLFYLFGRDDSIDVSHSYTLVSKPVEGDPVDPVTAVAQEYRFVRGKMVGNDTAPPRQEGGTHQRFLSFEIEYIVPQASAT